MTYLNLNTEKHLFPETPEDLYRMLKQEQAKIFCANVGERREVLLALKDADYPINSASLRYLPGDYTDFSYPHPGFDGGHIACFRSVGMLTKWILPEDALAALGMGGQPCVPDAEWFSSSLDELFDTVR